MLNVEIDLVHENGFGWYSKDNIYVKGYLFDKNNDFFEKKKLLSLFENIDKLEVLENLLLSFNGSFSIVIYTEEKLFFAVDRLRSFPLFYKKCGNEILITDTIIQKTEKLEDNSSEYYEFLLSGYTINDSTLLPEYKQVQASEIVYYAKEGFQKKQYFHHTHEDYLIINYKDYYKDLTRITDNFIERLVRSVGNKTIILPLSGGYDSRYILTALNKINFTNVICYTYGNKESFEIAIALKVATALGYELHIIEYTDKKWGALLDNPTFLDFLDYSFNYASLPHLQDFIALDELTSKNIMPCNSVIVPGFCGDLLGGSYMPIEVKEKKTSHLLKNSISEYIFKKHFNNLALVLPAEIKASIMKKIENNIGCNYVSSIDSFISCNESFFTEHKVSKFIVNANRPYEFFGHEWRMPLWDNELMEYWYKIPNHLRVDSKLYNDFLFDNLFDEQGVGFRKIKPTSHNKYLMIIRRFSPIKMLIKLKKLYYIFIYKSNDINNFSALGERLDIEIEERNVKYNNIMGLIAMWLLSKKG